MTANRIDPAAVRRYFESVGTSAAAAGYMAHERKLPAAAAEYRKQCELSTLRDWFEAVPPDARVLDAGCGAGNWTGILAGRFAHVVAIDGSEAMATAARRRLSSSPNVEIVVGDLRTELPPGPFDLVFVGGVLMYLNDDDADCVLRGLAQRLSARGSIILRESTVRHGRRVRDGSYQAIYRSVAEYRTLFANAATLLQGVRPNRGYERFEIAADLADLLPGPSGAITWLTVRALTPLTFLLLPRVMDASGIEWPRLQNHFFRLTRGRGESLE
jgi:trans-aconitate methyltransferase